MKKTRILREATSLNRAAFLVSLNDLSSGELTDRFLEQVLGGLLGADPSPDGCTEFSCSLFAPPPPES